MCDMKLEPYSMGIGDRFGHQGLAQLQAFILARERGISVTPVWNKSYREHALIGSEPADVRREADAAVQSLGWQGSYRVDADHINQKTMERFLEPCDFFTLDVSDFIGRPSPRDIVEAVVERHRRLLGLVRIPWLSVSLDITREQARSLVGRYYEAAREAGRMYRAITRVRRADSVIIEVSMDEAEQPQTPAELLWILAALADEGVPVQSFAPKFSGRFNKGVDYEGDVAAFSQEFEADLCVLAFARAELGLPETLKLSVHSGSDKFSLYDPIRRALGKYGAGLHVKTAGTTWLEELTGLAEAGGDALRLVKEIYRHAYSRLTELCAPYATVIAIDRRKLPAPDEVDRWTSADYVRSLRHDPASLHFNPHFRQLLHVAYPVAAQRGSEYRSALAAHAPTIARNVTENLFTRHLLRLFGCE